MKCPDTWSPNSRLSRKRGQGTQRPWCGLGSQRPPSPPGGCLGCSALRQGSGPQAAGDGGGGAGDVGEGRGAPGGSPRVGGRGPRLPSAGELGAPQLHPHSSRAVEQSPGGQRPCPGPVVRWGPSRLPELRGCWVVDGAPDGRGSRLQRSELCPRGPKSVPRPLGSSELCPGP